MHLEEDSLTIIKPQLKLKFKSKFQTQFQLRSTKTSLKTKMTSRRRLPRRNRHRRRVLAPIIAQYRLAQEEHRRQQLLDQEDIVALTMQHFNDSGSNLMTWTKYVQHCNRPPPLPKPAPSPTSTPTKPSSSKSPSTYTRSYGSFSRRRAERQEQTKRGSAPFSQRRKISTPNRRVLLSLLLILCALPVFHVGAADVQPVSEFNLVFEEIGLMASATD